MKILMKMEKRISKMEEKIEKEKKKIEKLKMEFSEDTMSEYDFISQKKRIEEKIKIIKLKNLLLNEKLSKRKKLLVQKING